MKYYQPSFETLEDRRTPAQLIDGTSIRFRDIDGDIAQIKLSRPVLTPDNVNGIFHFSIGSVDGNLANRQQLQSIDLSSALTLSQMKGLDLKVYRTGRRVGDGQVHVGSITMAGMRFVEIDGDLGRIQAGNYSDLYNGLVLNTLLTRSIGRYGLTTQDQNTASLTSSFYGGVNRLVITGDVRQATLSFNPSQDVIEGPVIKSISIRGSLLNANSSALGIISQVPLGAIHVGGDIRGGSQDYSTGVFAYSGFEQLYVGGSVVGGAGLASASILSWNNTQRIQIRGSLLGGDGAYSAAIQIGMSLNENHGFSSLQQLYIGGKVEVGNGGLSAAIRGSLHFGNIYIGGNVIGQESNPHEMLALGKNYYVGTTHDAIGSFFIGGNVRYARWSIGYHPYGDHDGNASIGKLRIRGYFDGSVLRVGSSGTKEFPDHPAQIRMLIIDGGIHALPGFLPSLIQVENIVFARVNKKVLPLTEGANNDRILVSLDSVLAEEPNFGYPPYP